MKVLSSLGILDEEELPEETIMQSVEGSNEGEANIVDVSSMSAEVDDRINQTINESDVEVSIRSVNKNQSNCLCTYLLLLINIRMME